ncbi:MAG: leucyl/phenylalanyl-tRNA--protein transferase [Gammaproteobacteria bacterium]
MSSLHWIATHDPVDAFPDVHRAFTDPDGLLAAGGDLSSGRLLAAYRRGIFPWYEEGQPILWWSPDPRTVFIPKDVHRSRSLQRDLKRRPVRVSINTVFDDVLSACAESRPGQHGTWITRDMEIAYQTLHREGHAHSIEVWRDDILLGGLYGIAIGPVFFGESMFSRDTNGSKIALTYLAQWLEKHDFALIDGQVKSSHLVSMGSIEVSRERFVSLLDQHCERSVDSNMWRKNDSLTI